MLLRTTFRHPLAAFAFSAAALLGCDGQQSGGELTAEVVGGDTVGGQFLTGSRVAVRFTNTADRALAYDQCYSGLEPASDESGIGRALLLICDPAPTLSLREVEAEAAVVDTVYVPRGLPAGRYRYVFPVYEADRDSVGDAVTNFIEVTPRP